MPPGSAPLGSPPSARRPPLPTRARTSPVRSGWDSPAPRPGPRAPRLWTASSPSAPACSGREGSAGRGARSPRVEVGAEPRGRVAPPESRPGPSGFLGQPPRALLTVPKRGGWMVRRGEPWGAVLEGRRQTAFGELFPETIQNPACFLRPPNGFLRESTPATVSLADFALPLPVWRSRTVCSEGGHTPQHSASALPSHGREQPQPPLSGAPVLRGRLRVVRLDPIVKLSVE